MMRINHRLIQLRVPISYNTAEKTRRFQVELLARQTGILIRNETPRYLEMVRIVYSTHSPRRYLVRVCFSV